MADLKISQLTAAATPLDGTETIPLVQTSTKRALLSDVKVYTSDSPTITAPVLVPSASVTPGTNGHLVIEATSNTIVKIKLKGSDGTVRSVTLNLA